MAEVDPQRLQRIQSMLGDAAMVGIDRVAKRLVVQDKTIQDYIRDVLDAYKEGFDDALRAIVWIAIEEGLEKR